MLAAP